MELCPDSQEFENIDLCILNTVGTLPRYEALRGNKLLIKNTDFYAIFFSETCRYYKVGMIRLKKNRSIRAEIHGNS